MAHWHTLLLWRLRQQILQPSIDRGWLEHHVEIAVRTEGWEDATAEDLENASVVQDQFEDLDEDLKKTERTVPI